jgi:hypothetical protein
MVIVLAGITIRPDLLGITSFIWAGFFNPAQYQTFAQFFPLPLSQSRLIALDIGHLSAATVRPVKRLSEGAFSTEQLFSNRFFRRLLALSRIFIRNAGKYNLILAKSL